MKKYHLTAKDIEYFNERVMYWAGKFQLSDWRVETEKSESHDNALAYTMCDDDSRVASIYVEPEWENEQPTKELIDNIACHEICEILTTKIRDSLEPMYSDSYIDELIHALIQRIVNMAINQ